MWPTTLKYNSIIYLSLAAAHPNWLTWEQELINNSTRHIIIQGKIKSVFERENMYRSVLSFTPPP